MPPVGKEEASGSPWMSSLPANSASAVPSPVGAPLRRAHVGRPRSIHVISLGDSEVLLQLPRGDLDAVVQPLLALEVDVAGEDVLAERLLHHLGMGHLLDGL